MPCATARGIFFRTRSEKACRMTPDSIWLVGSSQTVAGLFAGALPSERESRLLDDLEQVQQLLASWPRSPELIVLAQSRPGEFTNGAIEAVGRAAPLARVWRVAGSWCEGEGRSAPPPTGCTSAYWHQWPARWERELARSARGELPSWILPLTASPEERMLEIAAEPIAPGAGSVAVFARHPAAAAALVDVCRLGGYEPAVIDAACLLTKHDPAAPSPTHTSEPRPILWDTTPEQISDPAAIGRLREACGSGPIVAVVGFVRGEDCRLAAAAGVAAVITKPYLVHDLLWHLARAQDGSAA
jgi:hypothetical protein